MKEFFDISEYLQAWFKPRLLPSTELISNILILICRMCTLHQAENSDIENIRQSSSE